MNGSKNSEMMQLKVNEDGLFDLNGPNWQKWNSSQIGYQPPVWKLVATTAANPRNTHNSLWQALCCFHQADCSKGCPQPKPPALIGWPHPGTECVNPVTPMAKRLSKAHPPANLLPWARAYGSKIDQGSNLTRQSEALTLVKNILLINLGSKADLMDFL